MILQTYIQNNNGYRHHFVKLVTLNGKEETDEVAEQIAGCIRAHNGVDAAEEAVKPAGISSVQPN
jgi:hypothetical protein